MGNKFQYVCVNCGKTCGDTGIVYLCPDCVTENNPETPPKGVLKAVYNYPEIIQKYKGTHLFDNIKKAGFLDMLPIESLSSLSPLKVGNTPVYEFQSGELFDSESHFNVFFKDDSRNPTFSLKDRASDVVSAFAKEKGIDTIVAASTGNAGSSIAGLCASQKQRAIVMVPAAAPKAKLLQIMHYGAQIIPVEGTYDDAFELSIKVSDKLGFYNRNTAYNPLTVEGKKTVALEMFSDLKKQVPDIIFVPVGDGVIVSGVYKGFEDLLALGITEKMPLIVAVQSDKSQNIHANRLNADFRCIPAKTIADSISVDVPRNYYMTVDYLKKYNGQSLLVSDAEILKASCLLGRQGIFTEPASAAAYAGLLKYHEKQTVKNGANIVVLLTGSGLKDLKNIESLHKLPKSVNPFNGAVFSFLKKM